MQGKAMNNNLLTLVWIITVGSFSGGVFANCGSIDNAVENCGFDAVEDFIPNDGMGHWDLRSGDDSTATYDTEPDNGVPTPGVQLTIDPSGGNNDALVAQCIPQRVLLVADSLGRNQIFPIGFDIRDNPLVGGAGADACGVALTFYGDDNCEGEEITVATTQLQGAPDGEFMQFTTVRDQQTDETIAIPENANSIEVAAGCGLCLGFGGGTCDFHVDNVFVDISDSDIVLLDNFEGQSLFLEP